MHFTRPRELLVAGLIGLVLGFLLFQVAYGSLPAMPVAAGVTLLVLAAVETVLAFSIRNRIKTGRVLAAIAVARAVALAKASSLLGALMFGAWVGALGYLVPRGGWLPAAANDLPAALVGAASAAVLAGAALWLEHCCRTPDSGDQDRVNRPTG
ncbi:DUF3180 domain-containing protein [Amycolatopsis nigrescens]|uniref:DUF3180 domain-containing protein n=1 Tax=Amycolatopsis nigrescens TaxID=381445 RepID=UPI000364448C|nr:DUF3180 domain-containing protein [Amycolatopsis nigrescens]